MPRVSVIIPTYKREVFTAEAVQSVKAQTFQDFEIIVEEKEGVSTARNQGAKQARGKYLAFLDSDDLWQKKKLEKQLEFFRHHPEFRICYTDETWLLNGKHLNQHDRHRKMGGDIFAACLPLCIISASSIIIDRELFLSSGGFDERLPVCEDYDLWLRLALKYPIGYLNEKLIIKRGGHADQLSKKYWGMDRFRIKSLEKLLRDNKRVLSREKIDLVKNELRKKYVVLMKGAWKRKRFFYWLWLWVKQIKAKKM